MCYYSTDIGNELWESDGTTAGTKLVKDIYSGIPDSRPEHLTAFKGNLYFMAASGSFGRELWVSNGTESGTQMLKDINLGPNESAGSAIVVGGNALYFWASNGVSGKELWKTDGTEAGTVMIKDINPGPGNGAPSNPLSQYLWYGDRLLFLANDGINGTELWITDGTEAGTMMVQDITPGAGSSEISLYGVVNGTALFRCKDDAHGRELWATDGSPTGTALVKDILPGAVGGLELTFSTMVFQNYLFFGADDGVNGYELWRTNGTEAGTVLQSNIYPGSFSSYPGGLSLIGKTMFFFAETNTAGRELWKYDLTALSTDTPEALAASVFPTASADGRYSVQTTDPESAMRVEAYDLLGRLLAVRNLPQGEQALDLSALQPGAYVLRVAGADTGRVGTARVFVIR
ncbi:MAG: ELWxxDGT repeat protein [Saprospiraceae bacterium]